MIKYFSDVTKEVYDTPEALYEAEEKAAAAEAERKALLEKKAEEKKKIEKQRKSEEEEICDLAKEIVEKRKILENKLCAYTKKYGTFVIPDKIRDNTNVVRELVSFFRFLPFFF